MAVRSGLSENISMNVLRRLPKHALLVDFPPHVQAEIQRLLDSEARELRDECEKNAVVAPSRSDDNALDGCSDQLSAEVEGKLIPVSVGVDGEAVGSS